MHQPTSDVQIALAEVAGALESLMARESSALRDGLVNAQTLVRAALRDVRQRPLLGMAVRLLRQFEAEAGASTPPADEARQLADRLAELLPPIAQQVPPRT